jgi:hypothetical protein
VIARRWLWPALAAALVACGDGGGGSGPDTTPPIPGVSDTTPFTPGCDGAPSIATLYTNAEVEPFIAVNPLNPANLVGVWQQDRWSNGGARGVLAAASTDGGATWTPAQIPFSRCSGGTVANAGDYAKATDPWVSFGADGIAYFMALSFSSEPSAMLVSRSTDGGLSWEAPHTLVLSPDPNLFHDKNSITADPFADGHAYAIWDRFDFNTEEAPIWFSRTTDAGVSWEDARIIYDPGANFGTIGSQIAVLPDGTLVNLFTEAQRDNGAGWLRVIRSTDKGVNWSTPTTVADILMVGVHDSVTNLAVRGGGFIGAIGVGPTGMLYVAWADARFSGGLLDGIALSMSADGGLSWTEPVQVNGDETADAFTPALAVAPDGTIGVTYYDWRDDTSAASLPTSYWLATSTDGVTWSERPAGDDFDLAQAARSGCCFVFLGDYQGLAATADEFLAFFVGTNDSSSNRSDVRFSALPVDATTAKRAYAARPAPRVAMTPQWRARTATQLERTRKAQPDRDTPEYLRRRS